METFVILAAVVAAIFLVYGLLERAGLVEEPPCDCAACVHARRRDVTRGW